jgi:hypothetical protein
VTGSYILICTALGLALGWLPALFHGPIPEKYNLLYINGAVAVWGHYSARLLIGFMVGVAAWPGQWYVRGPLMGFLMLFPVSMISRGVPGCGPPCQFWNELTGTLVGLTVAGLARWLTGKDHR